MSKLLMAAFLLITSLVFTEYAEAQTITVSGLTGSCAGANGNYTGPQFSLPLWGKTSGLNQYWIDKQGGNWVIRLDGGATYATSPITNPNIPPCGPWTSVGSCTGTAVLVGGCQAASASCNITHIGGPLSQTVCVGVPIIPLTFSTLSATNVSTGNMPPGVSALFTGNATAGTITVSGTPTSIPAAYNPSLFVTAIGGTCTGINFVNYTVNLSAAPTISGPSNVVIGSTINLTGSGAPSGSPWMSNNGNVTVNSSGIVTGVTAGTSTITYTTSNNCSNTKVVNVLVSPLSVQYKDFNVHKEHTSSVLKWTTLNETNNKHFNILRSADGKHFERLGTVQTKATYGGSTGLLEYSFVDENPQIGSNYYKLEQVDFDNKKEFSNVINIIWGAQGSIISVYPTPTKDRLNIDIKADRTNQTEVRLIDMSGRVVKSLLVQTLKGTNQIALDLGRTASGVYSLQVYENNKLAYVSKILKEN